MKISTQHYRFIDSNQVETEDNSALRPANFYRRNFLPMSPKGGMTEVEIEVDEGGEKLTVYTGRACCSKNDNFSRKLGRTIALGRAQKEMRLR